MPRLFLKVLVAALAVAAPAARAQKNSPAKSAASPALVGSWSGTATIPLADSSIVVPVTYNFTKEASGLGGSAVVIGQGTGPISNVVQTGKKVEFRVTAPQGALDHEGEFTGDGVIEGMVMLNKLPVAKFKITFRKAAP